MSLTNTTRSSLGMTLNCNRKGMDDTLSVIHWNARGRLRDKVEHLTALSTHCSILCITESKLSEGEDTCVMNDDTALWNESLASDHYPVQVTMPLLVKRQCKPAALQHPRFDWNSGLHKRYEALLVQNLDGCPRRDSANDVYQHMHSAVFEAACGLMPRKGSGHIPANNSKPKPKASSRTVQGEPPCQQQLLRYR